MDSARSTTAISLQRRIFSSAAVYSELVWQGFSKAGTRAFNRISAMVGVGLLVLLGSGWAQSDVVQEPIGESRIWKVSQLSKLSDDTPDEASASSNVTRTDLKSHQPIDLDANVSTWLELKAQAQIRPNRTFLRIAYPHLWSAALYERLPNGEWHEEAAGVSVAQSTWPYPAVVPLFSLEASSDRPSTYWLRLTHDRAASVDLQLLTEAGLAPIAWGSTTRAGVLFGMFALLVLYAALQAFVQKSDSFLWLALYTAALGLAAACISGHAPLVLWNESVWLTFAMRGAMPALALAALAAFVGLTSPTARRGRWTSAILWLSGLTALGLATIATVWAYTVPAGVFSVLFIAALLGVVGVCIRVGSVHNPWPWWIAGSVSPLVTMTSMYLLANWLPSSWTGEHRVELLAWAMLAHGLTLSIALVARLRHFWSVRARADSSGDVDPLTGLTLPSIALQRRWPTMMRRAHYSQHACGAILIEWLNLDSIAKQSGQTVVQRLTLSAATRLTRVVRDIDVMAMPNASGFLILLESPVSRVEVRQMCIQIVAEGLKTNIERGLNFPLQFAVVGAVSGKLNLGGEELMVILQREVREMLTSDVRRIRAIDLP